MVNKILIYIYALLPKLVKRKYLEKKKIKFEQKRIFSTIEQDKQRLLHYGFAYADAIENKLAHLRMVIHFIEKGLTMPHARSCFGIWKLKAIAEIVESIGKEYASCHEMQYALVLLNEYVSFHQKRNVKIPDDHMAYINRVKTIISTTNSTCIHQRHYRVDDYFNISDGTFSMVAKSRHSARNYIDRPISQDIFIEVARIAATAPSACNRQPCKMHVITQKQLINRVFSLGVGCGGFGHLASAIILVTSDLACRNDIAERHQVGVDAGFFGMNLLYALHEKKIGACVLNWDNLIEQDMQLRKLIPTLKNSETLLFIVSCGYTPDEFDIPLGLKRPINEVIDFI